MRPKEIQELVKIVEESGISQLEVSRWGKKIRIIKNGNISENIETRVIEKVERPSAAPAVSVAAPVPAEPEKAPEPEKQENFLEVLSPIVGTFYRAPSPDSPPYVEIGDTVRKGQKLCIVEAMKVMNEIECEFDGVVAEIIPENAQPVDFNAVLFKVRPH